MSVTIEVEIAFARFVPVPRDGEINGVNAEIAVAIQQVSPEIRWNAIVEECGGMNEERHAIHAQLRVTTPLQYLHRANAGGRLRAWAAKDCRRHVRQPTHPEVKQTRLPQPRRRKFFSKEEPCTAMA